MIKKSKLIAGVSLIAIAAVFASAAFAATDKSVFKESYVRADVGYSYMPNKLRSSYLKKPDAAAVLDAGVGYVINDNFRTDLTANYRGKYEYSAVRNGISEKQKLDSMALMLNGYFDIKQFNKFTPYIMVGLGLSVNKAGEVKRPTDTVVENWKRDFAWQVGLGSTFKINDKFFADLQYKYVDLGENNEGRFLYTNSNPPNLVMGPLDKGKMRAHEISLGIIYKIIK